MSNFTKTPLQFVNSQSTFGERFTVGDGSGQDPTAVSPPADAPATDGLPTFGETSTATPPALPEAPRDPAVSAAPADGDPVDQTPPGPPDGADAAAPLPPVAPADPALASRAAQEPELAIDALLAAGLISSDDATAMREKLVAAATAAASSDGDADGA